MAFPSFQMNEAKVVNFHIGATRVATNILECLSEIGSGFKVPSSTHLISSREYKWRFRGPVNEKNDSKFQASIDEPGWLLYSKKLSGFSKIAASQHAMLGHPKKMFKAGSILPTAEKRVRRLSHMFRGKSLTLHLAIASQHDCLLALSDDVDQSKIRAEMTSTIPSWYDLVRAVRSASPEAAIVVWDFDQPNRVVLSFLSELLNEDPSSFGDAIKSKLRENSCQNIKIAQTVKKLIAFPEQLTVAFDEQYDFDLDNIDKMDGVTLVRAESIPGNLRL
jgi:hypothetical protein